MAGLENNPSGRKVIILGAGPAGLTAAYELTKQNIYPLVLEKTEGVGGIARTENYKGYYFDMGGHRFFSKSAAVKHFWNEVLGDDFLLRPRLSRIYYERKFFDYPLKPLNAVSKFGIWESILVGLSYLRWQIFPYRSEDTFEQWVTNRFGRRLFNMFFKTYTEKVWGISTMELNAEWAAQRIKDLDLKAAVLSMFIKPKNTITTLIEEFHYPRRGPGMLWEKVKSDVEIAGGEVWLNSRVCGFNRNGNRIDSINVLHDGRLVLFEATDFISSIPITEFLFKLNPPPPENVLYAASKLTYRDYFTVCLILDKEDLFDDNWIYIHDPSVKVGRIQNFKNWSPYMVPDQTKTSLGLEYFCNEGDELWNAADEELIELGKREIEIIGLAKATDVVDGVVYRVEKTYPVYDSHYQEYLRVIKSYIDTLENFQTIGRNGLHRYNNQDHAMLTGMLAVRNLLYGEKNNLWVVNAEQEYHEEIREPGAVNLEQFADEVFSRAFLKLDALGFGIALGLTSGLGLFFLSILIGLNDSNPLAKFLWLLGQYLPYYQPTINTSWLGFVYGFVIGFTGGYVIASLRNTILKIYISYLKHRAELKVLEQKGYFMDVQSEGPMDESDEEIGG
jgi:protoporphyrinogen oxidase